MSHSSASQHQLLLNPVEQESNFAYPVPHDNSTCPHIQPKRYLNGRLSRVQCCSLSALAIFLVLGGSIFGIVYSLGRSYAKTAINDSDIQFSMEMFNPLDYGFSVRIVGSIDNRNILDATLFPTTIHMGCDDVWFGSMPFPEIHLIGGASTPLNLTSFVNITNQDNFNVFATQLLKQPTVTLVLKSKVDVKAAGLQYNEIEFDKEMVLEGMAGLSDPPCQVLGQTIYRGDPDTLYIALNVSMDNRSPVSIDNMGIMNLSMVVDGVPVGFAVSDGKFSMLQGVTISNWITTITINPYNQPQIDMLLGSYARGGLQNVSLIGHANSTNITSLADSVAHLVINTTLDGLTHYEDKLIQVVYTNINEFASKSDLENCSYVSDPPINSLGMYQDVYMYVHNPFAAPISMDDVDFNVYWTNSLNGTIFIAHARARNISQMIPAGGTVVQAQRLCLTADLLGFLGQLNAFVNANGFDSKGVIPWNMGSLVNGTIKGDMQEFPTYFNYSQEFITVTQTTLL